MLLRVGGPMGTMDDPSLPLARMSFWDKSPNSFFFFFWSRSRRVLADENRTIVKPGAASMAVSDDIVKYCFKGPC